MKRLFNSLGLSFFHLDWAEKIARDEKLGVWNGNHQKPWQWRKAKRAKK